MAFLAACQEMGLPQNDDFNGEKQEGVGRYQVTQKNGERHSAADAFLRPALKRENLTAFIYAHVTRILFDGTKAVGVEYIRGNQTHQAFASQEVLLCSGAINSPQLLMCSGVGDAAHLQSMDVPIVLDLPGVGNNLQDHPKVDFQYTSIAHNSYDFSLRGNAYDEYVKSRTGLLSVVRSPVGGFLKTRSELDIPDLQLYAAQAAASDPQDFNIVVCLSRPKSRGEIALKSKNPFDHPRIQPNYLENKNDLAIFVESVHFVSELMQTRPFREFTDIEISPGVQIQTWLRNHIGTSWHYCGTCKMGVDAQSVVNPKLQVNGLEKLRIVDASIMPEITGGNINAVVIMIAEKAADLIINNT